jgi:hypothetical protein
MHRPHRLWSVVSIYQHICLFICLFIYLFYSLSHLYRHAVVPNHLRYPKGNRDVILMYVQCNQQYPCVATVAIHIYLNVLKKEISQQILICGFNRCDIIYKLHFYPPLPLVLCRMSTIKRFSSAVFTWIRCPLRCLQ